NTLAALGRYGEALDEFHAALRLDPNFLYSYGGLHRLYAAAGHKEKAALIARLAENVQRGRKVTREELEAVRSVIPNSPVGREDRDGKDGDLRNKKVRA
ncbi:MAG: hypothetical protein ACT4O3_04395, partial [Elusimicrobiota bacterium]